MSDIWSESTALIEFSKVISIFFDWLATSVFYHLLTRNIRLWSETEYVIGEENWFLDRDKYDK